MRNIRRKEKEIVDKKELLHILRTAKYVTLAMSHEDNPYLVTLSHGYDIDKDCIYFHCAKEGKKIDILKKNNKIWGQALLDHGYVDGSCDHLYVTVQFKGTVEMIDDVEDKKHALTVMINQQERDPEAVIKEQITESSLKRVGIGLISIHSMSGKKSKEVIISL